MDKEETSQYIIPKNIQTRILIFKQQDIGFFELGIITLGVVVGAIPSLIAYVISKHLMSFAFVVLFGFIAFLLTTKAPGAKTNGIDTLKNRHAYRKSQKKYTF